MFAANIKRRNHKMPSAPIKVRPPFTNLTKYLSLIINP